MRIGVRLQTENNKFEVFRVSIFNIAKLKPVNDKDVEQGTYIWDLKGDQFTSNMPIYEIENLISKEEEKFQYATILNIAKLLEQSKKKTTRVRKKNV